jgi:O-antigen ligase
VIRFLHPAAVLLALLAPWLLIHVFAAAEIGIDLIGACFLWHCIVARDWAWLRQAWVVVGLVWWGWLVVCTVLNLGLPGQNVMALLQAVALLRLLLLAAALEAWVLHGAQERRWFLASFSLATLYVALQVLLQFVTGHNLYGAPRWGDGSLTGPFTKPRAGPTFVRMLFPALLPAVGALLARPGRWPRLGGMALVLGGVGIVVLIGQRIPVLLSGLGLVLTGLILPRLRVMVAVGIVAGAMLIAASATLSPPTFYRLVTKFSQQMEGFSDSAYGLIATRSVAIAVQHPWTGRGYDGFRSGCPQPRYFQVWHWDGSMGAGDGGGGGMCVTHPHNFYLQAVTDAGLPGLALFCALVGVWLHRLGRGLVRDPDPVRAGLFVAAFIQLWPIASNSALQSMPVGVWLFLLLGFGLAEAKAAAAPRGVGAV